MVKNNFHFITIAIGVILMWRCIWGLADLSLLPQVLTLSLFFLVLVFSGSIILLLSNLDKYDISELI